MTKNNTQSKTYNSFGALTLLKLLQLEADKSHGGAFTVIAAAGDYKVLFGQGAPAQAVDVPAFGSLKAAIVNALVDRPTFAADESALAAGA